MPDSNRRKFTLRLDSGLVERVDALVERDPTTSSRNVWIARAIQEQVRREERRQEKRE